MTAVENEVPQQGHQRHRVNRNRITIMESILRVALNGALKTHIMYECNLSFDELKLYLEYLAQMGLVDKRISESNARASYYTTEKGRSVLGKIIQLGEVICLDAIFKL